MYFYEKQGDKFLCGMHFIHKAMSDVEFPATKKEIIHKIGNKQIKTNWDEYTTFEEIASPLKIEKFDSAAQFYNALIAVL